MSYLGSWKIDDYLTFCCSTHDPDTGVATDADSVPTYRVYENETATPILTGSTALLDTANTAGFYSERIQLTAVNGFEKGECYTIYITATVDSDTGTMHHNFQIEAEVDTNTASDLHADLDDGGRLDLLIDAIKVVTDALPDAGALSDLATILTDTNELQTDDIPTAITNLNDPTAATIADTVWNELSAGHVDAGKAGQQLWTDLDAVLTDTNELQTDDYPTSIAAIKTETALIVADTNELQTDDVPALIAALNNLSTAQVDTALTDIHLDYLLATNYNPASKPGVATALLNELIENDGGISRYTTNALEQAPSGSGGDATEAKQDTIITHLADVKGGTFAGATDSLEAIRDRGDAAWVTGSGGTAGSGAITFTYTLLSSIDSSPIPDADVWASSDQAGNNLLASGHTDQNGEVVFYLDAGTVYVWRQKSGWNFTNPDTEVVS